MRPPYLDPKKWIEDVKENLASGVKPARDPDSGVYVYPWKDLSFDDLADEVYGDEKPYSIKRIDMGDYGVEEDAGDFNFQEAFERDMLPQVEATAEQANKILGGDYFIVDSVDNEAQVTFAFDEEELPHLRKTGITSSDAAVSIFEGPLFEGAKVKAEMKVNPEGRHLPDPTTAKLYLPDISAKEAEQVPTDFQMSLTKNWTDDKAIPRAYKFTFAISGMTFEPQKNGMVHPKFEQTLKEYKHAT
jgi:hypothetical protein